MESAEEKTPESTATDAPAPGYSTPGVMRDGDFLLDCTPEQAERLIAFYEYATAQIERKPNPRLRAAPGDTGTVKWVWGEAVGITVPSGDPNNPYYVDAIPRITLTTSDAPVGRPFCAEFGPDPDPNGSYTASEGNDDDVLGLLVAYQKGQASAVGVQLALWYIFDDIPFNTHSAAASALSAGRSADTTGYTYLYWNGNGQPFVTLDKETPDDPGDPDNPPDDPPDEPEEPQNPNTRTEVTTTSKTRTEVRSNTTFAYSDAIGQITIAKRDNEGVSLDGAIFKIDIQFANGQKGGDSHWEVYNGSRLFTYTHPRNDVEPAKITVTEVRPPDGYTGSSTPQTATVHPTYTRITKVTTHTVTITTTTTTTSVIDIDSGEVLSESSADADAETSLNPPVVQEHTDFVEGDRETTMTFVNTPKPSSLTIYKYEKGSYNTALAGARFRIRYADINVSAQVWELTTGRDGTIRLDLPEAGTLVCEELQAPGGYEIGSQSTFTVTVAKGEDKRLDVSNDKRANLIVYKKCAVTGQLLGSAVFKATLIGQGVVKTATSGPDGKAVFTDLTPGQWRVEEQTPPPYYLPSTKVETVTIPDGSYRTLELTWENEPFSGLTIKKVSYQDGRGLEGAVFGLYRGTEANPLDFLGEFQTSSNGLVVIDKLESDQYYTVKELQPPLGHLLDEDNVRTILIKPDSLDNNLTLIFRNKEKPRILIEKVNDLGEPVPNCTFRVSRNDSAEYVEVTTGNDGTVLVEGLYEDWYHIYEIRSNGNVVMSDEVKDVLTEAGKTTTVQFTNYRRPVLTIQKVDGATGRGIDGVVIRVWREGPSYYDGPAAVESQFAVLASRTSRGYFDNYQDYTTAGGGYIRLTNEMPGTVICQEVKSAPGYVLSDEEHRITLEPGGKHSLVIQNMKVPKLTLRKVDEMQPSKGIPGVTFRFTRDGEGEYMDVTTDSRGIIEVPLAPGNWTYQETSVPSNYILNPAVGHITLAAGQDREITVTNRHKPSLLLRKIDSVTLQPLASVRFTMKYKDGKTLGTFSTDSNGEISLVNIEPGYLIITELPYAGYNALEQEREVLVEWGRVTEVTFRNEPENPLLIKKINDLGQPVEGCVLQVLNIDGGFVAEVKTGRNGYAVVTGLKPAWYLVKEIFVEGHILDDSPKQVQLKLGGGPAIIELVNKRLNGIEIYKESDSDEPLEGVEFTVKKENTLVGVYKTSAAGLIQLSDLEPGFYTVFESMALPGFQIDPAPRTVELKWGDYQRLDFVNVRFSDVQIVKRDKVNPELTIPGVKLRVEKISGEVVGRYTTDMKGSVICSLDSGWYRLVEEASVPGYSLNTEPVVFEVVKGKPCLVEFFNTPLSGLQILKKDQAGQPLGGVQFQVDELSGKRVGTFTTDDATGAVFVPNLEAGYYVVTETVGLPTHKWDKAPRNVLVEAGELNTVSFVNQAYPVLVVKKVSAEDGSPLGGVKFRLMDRYQREIGIYTTHAETGQIILTGMDAGKFYLQEAEAKQGFKLDSTIREITLEWGKETSVTIKNEPLASLRITKISKYDKKPLPGVSFLLYDMKNNVLGEYTTNNLGVIELPQTFPAGRYRLKEVKTDPNHVLDEQARDIELKAGATLELTIENEPKRGSVQIVKKAAADNAVTRDKAGAVLEGARFEIYDKDLNVVDKITSDKRGIATTKPLPLGTYGIKEVSAPEHYFTEGKVFYAEIKMIRFEVLNNPAELGVTVEKRGNVEVIAGDEMRYDFSNIANTSNVELEDFTWHDKLPADAVRLKTIHTGTWNEKLTYSVTYRTNGKSGYRTLAANLSSASSHTLDCSPAALKLAADEYITEIRFNFGTVKAGFQETEGPTFVVKTLATLPDGHRIVNHTGVSGESGGKEIAAQDQWVTVALGKPKYALPRTGY